MNALKLIEDCWSLWELEELDLVINTGMVEVPS